MLSPRLFVTLFTLLFLNKQTEHGRSIVSFSFFLFICCRAKCLSREQCVAALCSSCSLQKYLGRRRAALNEAGRPLSVLMKRHTITRVEFHTFHLSQHYLLFMHNKFQYTWRGDYCECVRPAQLPVLTWGSSSVPPGTTPTICSPPVLCRIQHTRWLPWMFPTFLQSMAGVCSCTRGVLKEM